MHKFWIKASALLLSIPIIAGTMTGCGILKSNTATENKNIATNDSNALVSDYYYIWHDENQTNIENDINTNLSKFKNYSYKIFNPIYTDGAIRGEDTVGNNYRIYWMLGENDSKIPTFYKGDELIYYSETSIPTKYEFERFYDHGYSIGIWGLRETIVGSGNYSLDSDKEIGVKAGSSCDFLTSTLSQEDQTISLTTVGDMKIGPDNVSKSGTVKGLLYGSKYDATFYLGTKRYVKQVIADTRIFSSFESKTFSTNQYEFVGKGIIKIHLPEYLKTGYYIVNGVGLFRYVAEEEYTSNTNFNDPIIIKDDTGHVIYDPTKDIQFVKSETNNTDIINEQGNVTSIKKSLNISPNDKVNVAVNFNGAVDQTKEQYVQIQYYMQTTKDGSDVNDKSIGTGDAGTSSNPYIIKANEDELKSGYLERELHKLVEGNWIFEIFGLDNYSSYNVDINASTDIENANTGDF